MEAISGRETIQEIAYDHASHIDRCHYLQDLFRLSAQPVNVGLSIVDGCSTPTSKQSHQLSFGVGWEACPPSPGTNCCTRVGDYTSE